MYFAVRVSTSCVFLSASERLSHKPIIEGPKNQTVAVGDTAVLTCKIVLSDLHPHLQWLKHYQINDSYVTEEGEPYVNVIQVSFLVAVVTLVFFFPFWE